jgi:hypothetical protein
MDTAHEALERAWQAHFSGEFETALQNYVWVYEEAALTDPAMAPLRLSYALGGWAKLAEEYLPARHALVEVRDRDTRRLLDGGGDATLFNDVRAVNDKLGDLARTHSLFKHLHQHAPDLAQRCARSALPSLVACADYAMARNYLTEPQDHLARHAALLNDSTAQLDALSEAGMSRLLAEVFNYSKEVTLVLDLLNGCGDTAAAALVRKYAIELATLPQVRACVQAELDMPGTTLDAMVELRTPPVTEQ